MIKGKTYPTLVAQVTDPDLDVDAGEEGRETMEIVTSLTTWKKDRRFVASRVLKDEKNRAQISFLEGEEYAYSFFVTNTELFPEEAVDFYQKRDNRENYIKEAKYDIAVGQLLLKSFWSNEAIFQLMMLAYNLFLLLKIDRLKPMEYRQQIKTFRLKYIFLAGKYEPASAEEKGRNPRTDYKRMSLLPDRYTKRGQTLPPLHFTVNLIRPTLLVKETDGKHTHKRPRRSFKKLKHNQNAAPLDPGYIVDSIHQCNFDWAGEEVLISRAREVFFGYIFYWIFK